jgi:hypothetical protein
MLRRSTDGAAELGMHESFPDESDRAAKCEADGGRLDIGQIWRGPQVTFQGYCGDEASRGRYASDHAAVALKDVHRDVELKIQPREGI